MASLLSLKPARSLVEAQTHTRSKILNSPALPSSSGLLTSFGGLKKEESLGKSTPLTRNALGITIKRSKVEEKDTQSKLQDASPKENKLVETTDLKDNLGEDKGEINVNIKDISDTKDEKVIKDEEKDTVKKQLSLVGDYSSSEESS